MIEVNMSNKGQRLHFLYHRMKFAKVILDWRSRENDPPRSLQDPKHGRSLVIGRLKPVTYCLLSTETDGSAHDLLTFIGNDEPNRWAKQKVVERRN